MSGYNFRKGREEKCPASGETGWACSRDEFGDGAPREAYRHNEDKNLFVVISMQWLLVIHAAGRIPLSATGGSSAVGVHWFPD